MKRILLALAMVAPAIMPARSAETGPQPSDACRSAISMSLPYAERQKWMTICQSEGAREQEQKRAQAPAAVEIGTILRFNNPVPGCHFFGDAREALRLRTLYGNREVDSFMRRIRIEYERQGGQWRANEKWRVCGWTSDAEYEVVDKYKDQWSGDSTWYCLQPVDQFNVGNPDRKPVSVDPKLNCSWSFAPDSPVGVYNVKPVK